MQGGERKGRITKDEGFSGKRKGGRGGGLASLTVLPHLGWECGERGP